MIRVYKIDGRYVARWRCSKCLSEHDELESCRTGTRGAEWQTRVDQRNHPHHVST